MVLGTGIDIVEIERVNIAVKKHDRFIFRYFTENERIYWLSRKETAQTIAGMFAAKEAVIKALNGGFMNDIEINHEERGKPFVVLTGRTASLILHLQNPVLHVTISHAKHYAVAQAILEERHN